MVDISKTEKIKNAFKASMYIMCGAVTIDLITTAIAIIVFRGEGAELNLWLNQLLSVLGIYGLIPGLLIYYLMFCMLLIFYPMLLKFLYEKSTNSKFKPDWISLTYVIIATTYTFLDSFAIINNSIQIAIKLLNF